MRKYDEMIEVQTCDGKTHIFPNTHPNMDKAKALAEKDALANAHGGSGIGNQVAWIGTEECFAVDSTCSFILSPVVTVSEVMVPMDEDD